MTGDAKSPPIGAIGGYVMANVKALRKGVSLQALYERLKGLGRSVLPIGLSRLENGQRRVDADDLVALAIALGVNPNALLLPRDVPPDAEVELTPGVRVRAWAAWAWADGRMPLPAGPADTARARERFARELNFARSARPDFAGQASEVVVQAYELGDQIWDLETAEDPELQDMRRARVSRTLRKLVVDLEDLFNRRPGLAGVPALSAEQLREAVRTLPESAVRDAEPYKKAGENT